MENNLCNQAGWDPPEYKCLPMSLFLLCRKKASASQTLPEFQRVDSNRCSLGEVDVRECRKNQQCRYGAESSFHLVLPQRIYIIYGTIPLISSVGTKAPIQVEDGNFKLNTRFLEQHPVTTKSTILMKVVDNVHSDPFPK